MKYTKYINLNNQKQKEIYDIISMESFPDEYIHFNEDFNLIGKGLSVASGRVCVDGKIYSFYWNYKNGILKNSINLIEVKK